MSSRSGVSFKALVAVVGAGIGIAMLPAEGFAQTEKKPLWEIGAGFAAIDFPVYRGAIERKAYLLPVPYFVYRGEVVQVDRERLRGLIFRRDWGDMDISVNGSVPTRSKDSVVRNGMADLDPTLELGPSLNFHLYHSNDGKEGVNVRLPLRAAVASNLSSRSRHVGWLFQPQLNYDLRNISGSGWNLGLLGGPLFADRSYHGYFYDVAPQYATATRPAYSAGGGYSGAQFIFALNKRYENHWAGGFMKLDNLAGAAFVNSPLVTNRRYFTVGFAVTWVLDRSERMVEVNGN